MNYFLLFKISRPTFWLYLLGPYFIGIISGSSSVTDLYDTTILLYIGYFLLPANFYLYGINDYFDGDTDKYNVRKRDKEHYMSTHEKKYIWLLLCVMIVITLGMISLASDVVIRLLLCAFIILSTIYSAPPLRLKSTVFLDSLTNILYIIPGIIGYYYMTNMFPSGLYIIGATCWVAAMHLFSAIPDITVDKKATLMTTAIFLGERKSLLFCSLLWLVFSVIYISSSILFPATILLLLYPLLPLLVFFKYVSVAKMYNAFPIINSGIGFIFFILLFFSKLYV